MKINTSLLIAIFCSILFTSCDSEVYEYPAKIRYGGVTTSITVNPNNNNHVIAAVPFGGLFRSLDGGNSWLHFETLKPFHITDVKYCPHNPNIIIATAGIDLSNTDNSSGIWISSNGGTGWSRPLSALPPNNGWCRKDKSAYCIAFDPERRGYVYVATDYGIAISADSGTTWRHVAVDSTIRSNSDSDQCKVWTLAVCRNSRLVAAMDNKIAYSDPPYNTWRSANISDSSCYRWANHSLASSPYNNNYVYYVNGPKTVYVSRDGGANWTVIDTTHRNPNVPSYLCVQKVATTQNEVMLYFGNGFHTFKIQANESNTGFRYTGTWQQIAVPGRINSDPHELALNGAKTTPLFIACDGGVYKTTDGGNVFNIAGTPNNGYNGLNMTEVTTQYISSSRHQDIYAAHWDNSMWCSSDGGRTWPDNQQYCCEGYYAQPGKPEQVNHDSIVLSWGCSGCQVRTDRYHFQSWDSFRTYTMPARQTQLQMPFVTNPNTHIRVGQPLGLSGTVIPNLFMVNITRNYGRTWQILTNTTNQPIDPPIIVNQPTQSNIYYPFNTGSQTAFFRFSINDANGAISNSSAVFPNGFNYLLSHRSHWIMGVDPFNPDHIIAADATDKVMKLSNDGGQSWDTMRVLTDSILNRGQLMFNNSGAFENLCQPTVVAFNPFVRNHILVGTYSNGIFSSRDGGTTWKKLKLSNRATYITSIAFLKNGQALVATYGRGLWKVREDLGFRSPIISNFEPTLWNPASQMNMPLTSETLLKHTNAQWLVVNDGFITDIREKNNILNELVISSGSIHRLTSSLMQLPLDIKVTNNRYANNDKAHLLFRKLLDKNLKIKALMLVNNKIEGFVTSCNSNLTIFNNNTLLGDTMTFYPYVYLSQYNSQGGAEPNFASDQPLFINCSNMNIQDCEIIIDDIKIDIAKVDVINEKLVRIIIAPILQTGLHKLELTAKNNGNPVHYTQRFWTRPNDE